MVGLIQFGLHLYVMAFMALYCIRVLDVPGLFIFIVDKHGFPVLIFDPAGQAHGLVFCRSLSFFLLRCGCVMIARCGCVMIARCGCVLIARCGCVLIRGPSVVHAWSCPLTSGSRLWFHAWSCPL